MNKTNTIPDEYEREAVLSTWLRCYPFMARKPRLWGLHRVPVTPRCRALYPDIVRSLQGDSVPMVLDFPATQESVKGIAA